MADVPEDVQRWTAKRRVALVLSIVRGETSVAEAARKHGPAHHGPLFRLPISS